MTRQLLPSPSSRALGLALGLGLGLALGLGLGLALVLPACKKEPATTPSPEPKKKAEATRAEATRAEATGAEASRAGATRAGAARAEDGAFPQAVLAALTRAGCKVGAFEQTAARPYQAKACLHGEVDGLDVLLCSFDGDQAARAAESALLLFVGGATTGAVRSRGAVTLAVADRKKVDIKGKQINKVLTTFSTGT